MSDDQYPVIDVRAYPPDTSIIDDDVSANVRYLCVTANGYKEGRVSVGLDYQRHDDDDNVGDGWEIDLDPDTAEAFGKALVRAAADARGQA